MTLQEQIRSGKIEDNLTIYMLDKITDGDSLWHIAAKAGTINCIPEELFNSSSMMIKNGEGNTVWHRAAFSNNLKDIPQHLFTSEALAQTNRYKRTVFHAAGNGGCLNAIPKHLFTEEVMNQKDCNNETFWHQAAVFKCLKNIPKVLFTEDAFYQQNNTGANVWGIIAKRNIIKDVPIHLITPTLLTMSHNGKPLFNKDDTDYVNEVIDKLGRFIETYPNLEKDIIHRDSRLILTDIQQDCLWFKFKGADTNSIILNENGVFFNDTRSRNFKTLSNIVTFTEQKFDVEQSIVVPQSQNTQISEFSL